MIDALQRGRERQLTLIHAPAGFGKTTLASQWRDRLVAEGRAVAWMSVDRDDDNPVWLLGHLIEAIREVRPDLTGGFMALLERYVHDAHRYVLPALINEIDSSGDSSPSNERRKRAGCAADHDVLRRRALEPACVNEHIEIKTGERERCRNNVHKVREEKSGSGCKCNAERKH